MCWRFTSSTSRSRDGSATLTSTDARSRSRSKSRSRSPQGRLSSRQLNCGSNDVALSSDLSLSRPWLGLPTFPLLRNTGTDPQLMRRYEANPFVSLTAGSLLSQPHFETCPASVLPAVPRVPASLGGRSAELPASTTDDQKLPSSSTVITASNLLPASKLITAADVHVPAYLDFRSRDVAPTNGIVVPSES